MRTMNVGLPATRLCPHSHTLYSTSSTIQRSGILSRIEQYCSRKFGIFNDHLDLSIDDMTDAMYLNDDLFNAGTKYAEYLADRPR